MASSDDMTTSVEPKGWGRLWQIFDEALALSGPERAAALDRLCGEDAALRSEVESLLEAHDQDSLLGEEPLAEILPSLLEEGLGDGPEELKPPKPEIDRYELLEPLGSGGMGQVFAARRADGLYDEVVAVKVLRLGLDTGSLIQRFRSERRILARLSHRHIARLLDGGSTRDGRPYLVMERVVGTRIDDYCDHHRLSIPQRLKLFQKVCRAVHFAHRNLVIHRDLKPGNILIDEAGEPKLLDFGIAKLLEEPTGGGFEVTLTEPGRAPMTPQYASPEQVTGQGATTASDVYSLGMLLYKLLTGDLPYRLGSAADLAWVLQESEPEKPSRRVQSLPGTETASGTRSRPAAPLSPAEEGERRRRAATLRGDLDNIVLKALAKSPEERYSSAEALAEDLERYGQGLPVRAQVDSVAYRASKFVQRHFVAVSIGIAALISLLLLLATLLTQRQQILAERDRVIDENKRATYVTDFLVELFTIPDPTRAQGETVTARQLLERGVIQIEQGEGFEPRSQSALLLSMGRSLAGLGLYEEALPHLKRSVELRQDMALVDEQGVTEALIRYAEVLSLAGHYNRAEPPLRRALQIREQAPDSSALDLAEVHTHLGNLLSRNSRLSEAGREFELAEKLAREAGGKEILARVLDRHASLHQSQGDLEKARAKFDESLALYRQIYGQSHSHLALVLNNSALLAFDLGDFARSEELFREAEAIQREVFNGDHPDLANTLANLGLLMQEMASWEAAVAWNEEALAMYQRTLGPIHPKVATTLVNRATLESDRGRHGEAEARYREVLAIQQKILDPDHENIAETRNNLAYVLAIQNQIDEAEPLFLQALESFRQAYGPAHGKVAATSVNLADIALQRGDFERAEELAREAVHILREDQKAGGSAAGADDLAAALNILAGIEQSKGNLTAAMAMREESVALMGETLGEDHPDLALLRVLLAHLYLKLERFDEAAATAGRALEILREKLPDQEAWIRSAERTLERSRPGNRG